MRADLARREPEWLARWASERQYERILEARLRDEAPEYVLHDGPPYATGAIHYGTVMNKVLKDIVVRSQLLMGKRAVYRPGWDCHGLPIEQQVEKNLGKDARGLDAVEFRQRCEEHAMKFVDVMRTEFKRLGCLGRWDDPYLTLAKDYEATIARQLAGFVARGLRLPRQEAGALVLRPPHGAGRGRGRVRGPRLTVDLRAVPDCRRHRQGRAAPARPARRVRHLDDDPLDAAREPGRRRATRSWTTSRSRATGEYLIVAAGLAESFLAATGIVAPQETWIPIPREGLRALEGTAYTPPFPRPGADAKRDYRLWFARHATLEAGTGLVHTAPGHGAEDYIVGREHGLRDLRARRRERPLHGRHRRLIANWEGMKVFEANPSIVDLSERRRWLLNKPGETVRHQYPHCWRCKNPIIFRATEQWFARLGDADDETSLRHRALAEIAKTQWIPPWGENRIRGMIEARPDWCLSRQRVWGVPIPAFRCTKCGKDLLDAKVIEHVADIFAREGSNAWFARPAAELLPRARRCLRVRRREFDKQHDIVDVWFESGVSWAAVAEGKLLPAGEKVDLYLEGADQHRGWFHSSLLTAAATRGHAPYKAVLTHGWVLDERGKPYSKSEIAKARAAGAKIDYVDPGGLDGEERRRAAAPVDRRRRLPGRRRLLGDDPGPAGRVVPEDPQHLPLPAVEPLRLRAVARSAGGPRAARAGPAGAGRSARARPPDLRLLQAVTRSTRLCALMNDYAITVSAEYLDPIKDPLYCEAPASRVRRSVQTAVHEIVRTIVAVDGADPLLHGAGRRRRAGAGDRRAVRRPRRRARRSTRARSW